MPVVAIDTTVLLEYLYTFDPHFDRFDWVTRLNTPDNPFA